jgi:hypothetical protein
LDNPFYALLKADIGFPAQFFPGLVQVENFTTVVFLPRRPKFNVDFIFKQVSYEISKLFNSD